MTQEFWKIDLKLLNNELQNQLKRQDEQLRKTEPELNLSMQASKKLASISKNLLNKAAERLEKTKVVDNNKPKKINKFKSTTDFERH